MTGKNNVHYLKTKVVFMRLIPKLDDAFLTKGLKRL
jgi:hypothetical protein